MSGLKQLRRSASRSKPEKIKRKAYDEELRKLHVELVKLQEWVKHKGLKVCIVFEGRDGAGKGGTIKAITERVSPRVFRVVALPAPTEREKTQMYLQRYIPHLPAAGEIVIFDRSWYNRAGVERVMGLCSQDDVKDFLLATPIVERAFVESGIVLLKYWLEVSRAEQTRRLENRIDDGRKTWKLSPMDLESYSHWYDYSRARDEMFAATDTAWRPGTWRTPTISGGLASTLSGICLPLFLTRRSSATRSGFPSDQTKAAMTMSCHSPREIWSPNVISSRNNRTHVKAMPRHNAHFVPKGARIRAQRVRRGTYSSYRPLIL